jgi:hypothetical protein
MLKADGFNKAIIGMCHDIATGEERLIYDANICIDMLIEQGMSENGERNYLHPRKRPRMKKYIHVKFI